MPWFGWARKNRSAEHAEAAERLKQKQRDSWARLQAQVAAKYHGNGSKA